MKKHIDSLSKSTAKSKAEKPVETPAAVTPPPAEKEKEEIKPVTPPPAPAPAPETTQQTVEASEPEPEAPAPADSFESLFPEPSVAIAGPPSWIWWTLLIIASAALGIVGYSLAQGRLTTWLTHTVATPTPKPTVAIASATPTSTPTATATATATPTPTPSPTATPTATPASINKAAISLRVLNGTTVAGAASTAKTVLEKAGFTVQSIGNAHNQDYTSTVIYYQTGKQAEAAAVQSALTGYSTSLQESSLADPDNVLVVIGTK